MKATRSRKNQLAYDRYRKELPANAPCQFCLIETNDPQFASETQHFKIIHNLFPYNIWDDHKVGEHLMIVPKKHTDTLKSLSFEETKEYVELVIEYEYNGFNIYARSPGSKSKSILHQHTHLIKFVPGSKGQNTFKLKTSLFSRKK